MTEEDIPKLKWTEGGMVPDDKGGYVFRVDYEIIKQKLDAMTKELKQADYVG